MYGVDFKEGGGQGVDLNVHWTLKNFFFDLSMPPNILLLMKNIFL